MFWKHMDQNRRFKKYRDQNELKPELQVYYLIPQNLEHTK